MALAEHQLTAMGHAALAYAARGWAVAPLHSALTLTTTEGVEARCTCGNKACVSPGKHPRTKHGIKEASSDPDIVRGWWTSWAGASIALACGLASGLWVLDVDAKLPKHKDGEQVLDGLVALDLLEQKNGALPATLTSATGGGGKHLFFRLPEGRTIKNKVAIRGPGGQRTALDVRSTGGYVVLPPSPHVSGTAYAWATPPDHELADAPEWLLDLVDPPEVRPAIAPAPLPADDGTRERAYIRAMLDNAAKRIREATEGARHEVMFLEANIVGGYVAGGHLGLDEAFAVLEAAGLATGKAPKEVSRTIRDGLRTGSDTPRHPPQPTRTTREPRQFDPPPRDDAPPPTDEDLGFRAARPVSAGDEEDDSGPVDLGDARKRHEIKVRLHRMADRYDIKDGSKKLGLPKPTLENAIGILRDDPQFAGRFSFNAFSHEVLIDGKELTDADLVSIRYEIDRLYRCGLRHDMTDHAISYVARDKEYDPLTDYLEGLRWDGKARLDTWLTDYLGAAPTELNHVYAVRWMVSAVARALRPGCKADLVLTLKSEQYEGKSRACRILARDESWFFDDYIDIRSKEGALALEGRWLVELAELESISKRDVETVKAFLTRQIDKVRRPWDRKVVSLPRRCLFIATTNADRFLKDPTGARRFAVVHCGTVQLDALERDRDQLWAEAVRAYRDGMPWHLTRDEFVMQREMNKTWESQDPWVDMIRDWLNDPLRTPSPEINPTDLMTKALRLDGRSMDHGASIRLGHAMKVLGYEHFQKRRGGKTGWLYRPVPTLDIDPA